MVHLDNGYKNSTNMEDPNNSYLYLYISRLKSSSYNEYDDDELKYIC